MIKCWQKILLTACSVCVMYIALFKQSETHKNVSTFVRTLADKNKAIENEQFDVVRKRFDGRMTKMLTQCRSLSIGAQPPPWSRMTFSPKYKSFACLISKNGYTTWCIHFLKMNGLLYPTSEQIYSRQMMGVHLLGDFGAVEKQYFSHGVTRMFTTRHPLERLVSAFGNKFKKGSTNDSRIIAQWYDWAEMVLQTNLTSAIDKDGRAITFEQFLEFVTTGTVWKDEHFKPVYKTCDVCSTPFDYILHQDTYEEDLQYILSSLGVTETESDVRANQNKKGYDYMALYNPVKPQILQKVYDLVQVDMALFGYEFPKDFLNKITTRY